jgi:hypothetical protein
VCECVNDHYFGPYGWNDETGQPRKMSEIEKYGDDPLFDRYLKYTKELMYGPEKEIIVHPEEQEPTSEIKLFKEQPKNPPLIQVIGETITQGCVIDDDFLSSTGYVTPNYQTKHTADGIELILHMPEIVRLPLI